MITFSSLPYYLTDFKYLTGAFLKKDIFAH